MLPTPPARRELMIDGSRLSYLDMGNGAEVCLLIHGLGGCAQHWALTIPALAATRRVLAVDLPGFGASEKLRARGVKPVVQAIDLLRRQSGADRVDVLGHSLGTLVACEVAARLPHTVRRLVLAGGPITSVVALFHHPIATLRRDPHLVNFLAEAATAGIPLPGPVREWISRSRTARRLTLAPYVHSPARLPAATASLALRGAGGPGTLSTLKQGFGYDFTPALDGVSCPALLIGGAHDRIAPAADLRAFAAADPAARRVEILPDAAHLPMLEQPRRFNELVDEFLCGGGARRR